MDKWRQSSSEWPLKQGVAIGLSIGNQQIINGYVDRLDVSVSNDDRSINIEGRDRASDLVDSSAGVSLKTEFINQTLKDIANNYAGLFGLTVTAEADVGAAFTKFTIKQGETCFEAIERAAKLRGLLVLTDEFGNLKLTNRASGGTALPSAKNLTSSFDFVSAVKTIDPSRVALVQGENILSASCSYDDTERFQSYVVKGQNISTDNFFGTAATQVTAVAFDQGVERVRSTIIISDTPLDLASAKQRAAWEATVRAAKSISLSVTVQSWFRSDGKLWGVNEIVPVEAGFVGVNSPMLITGVEFTKDNSGGTLTNLRLTRSDAYAAQATVPKSESVVGWDKQINQGISKLKALGK